MSTQQISVEEKIKQVFGEIEGIAKLQKESSGTFIKLEDGKNITLQFQYLSGREEDIPKPVEELYEPKNDDGTPKLGEDGKPISRKTKKVYFNVKNPNDPNDPNGIKIWKATPVDAATYLKKFFEMKKSVVSITRSGTGLKTRYTYIPVA